MKKCWLAGLMCLLLAMSLAACPGMAEEYDGVSTMYVVNCSEWVSLRSSPSTSAARVAKVPLGAAVTDCRTASTTFTYCTYNGASGYVLTEYLSVNAPYEGGSESYVGEMRVVNCSEWVSLRSRPSTSSARLAKVPLGAVLMECTRYSSQFIYGNYNGQWGYVLSEYLSRVPDKVTEGDGYVGEMTVVNCNEWVSLREAPSTSASRITTVPLGATVSNCTWYSNNFICCDYNGYTGYILSSYLQPTGRSESFATAAQSGESESFAAADQTAGESFAAMPQPGGAPAQSHAGDLILEHTLLDYTVYAYHTYGTDSETLYLECVDGQGAQIWNYTTNVPFTTELQCADAFIGGTADKPLVLVYNAGEGLYALEYLTGQLQWLVPTATVNLGGGICHAVDRDGTMYIGGYYGPDPVAIDVAGRVLWEAKTNRDAYWMHEIEVTDEGVLATYDCIDEHEAKGTILYDFNGGELSVNWF